MPIQLHPFEDMAALSVFNHLDIHDHMEAEAVRGVTTSGLALFADWRAVQGHALLSVIAMTGGAAERPFAVLQLCHTGQAGVAQAAMLARDHARHAMALARLAVLIRTQMPQFCAERGVSRIEARSWAPHPTASRLLQAMGFAHECDMPGFGGRGEHIFRQFAFTYPATSKSNHQQNEADHVCYQTKQAEAGADRSL